MMRRVLFATLAPFLLAAEVHAQAPTPPTKAPPAQPAAPKGGGDQVRPTTHTDTEGKRTAVAGTSSYGNALRIAKMLNEERTVATLLTRQGLRRDATDGDVDAVIAAYEALGEPEVAVRFLRDRAAMYPKEKRPRVLLAALYARSGESVKAVQVWKDQIAAFGKDALSIDEAVLYARDLSRTGDTDAAYALLVPLTKKAGADAKEFWSDVGVLAWDRDDDSNATLAYEKLYTLEAKAPHAGQRLCTLYADAGRFDDAASIALAEHVRTGDPKAALLVAHQRAALNQWDKVKELLDALERAPRPEGSPALSQSEDFLLLRGDARRQSRDLLGASDSYRRALAIAPQSMLARANLLWTLLELNDKTRLKQLAVAWSATSLEEPLLWAPMALALGRVDLTMESLPYFERQLKANPKDGRVLLDLAEVLTKMDRHAFAQDARRRAVILLRAEAVKALHVNQPTPDELHLVEAAAGVVRERSGNVQGERWLSAMQRSNPKLIGQEETVLDWYMSTDRDGYGRRLLGRKNFRGRDFRKYRLALAMKEEDRQTISSLLDSSSSREDIPAEERMHARLQLNDDNAAASQIGEGLASGRPLADDVTMRTELERIYFQHKPNVRVGVSFMHVTGLDAYGPHAHLSHDAFGGRLTYSAAAIDMADRSTLLGLAGSTVREGAFAGTYRFMNPRGVTETSIGGTYQEDNTAALRISFVDQRLVTGRLGITTDLRLGQRIDDTSFLRLLGQRNIAGLGVRYDEATWYATVDVEGRNDLTRKYEQLAWDLVETGEVGYKILNREPHLSVGAQVQASQRDNRRETDLPDSVRRFVTPALGYTRALPPSFQLVGGVVHFSRGDFLERYRPERSAFPRYDCELAIGALFPADTAIHVLCGASFRSPGGYVTALAFYNRAVAGVRNSENAELALSYTIPF